MQIRYGTLDDFDDFPNDPNGRRDERRPDLAQDRPREKTVGELAQDRPREKTVGDLSGLEGLDIDDVSSLSDDELYALHAFEGFWSSVTKPFKKAAKVVKGAVKVHTKGIVSLGKAAAKVGRFVVETPTLRKVIGAASVPFTGPSGPVLFEVAASIASQHATAKRKGGKGRRAVPKALVEKARAAGVAKRIARPPGRTWKKGEVRAVLGAAAKLDSVRLRILQRMIRAGIGAPLALRIVSPEHAKEAGAQAKCVCPTIPEVKRMASLASLALEAEKLEGFAAPLAA